MSQYTDDRIMPLLSWWQTKMLAMLRKKSIGLHCVLQGCASILLARFFWEDRFHGLRFAPPMASFCRRFAALFGCLLGFDVSITIWQPLVLFCGNRGANYSYLTFFVCLEEAFEASHG